MSELKSKCWGAVVNDTKTPMLTDMDEILIFNGWACSRCNKKLFTNELNGKPTEVEEKEGEGDG